MKIFNKFLVAVSVLTISVGCVPNSGIPAIPINNPGFPDPLNPGEPLNPGDPNGNNPKPPATEPGEPHPPPPDPGQPTNEDDFWALMRRFGFFESKTKEQLQADIKRSVALQIKDWSPGTYRDKQKNIDAKFKSSAKYLKPAITDVNEYVAKSMALAAKPTPSIDFYLDVDYGPKERRGEIVLQKVDPRTLEVLFFNKSGLINNYTQTDGALLRLTHFMMIPPSVYE